MGILTIFILAIILRLSLSTLPSFEYDMSAYRSWTQRLVEQGPANFYSSEVFTNNPLGYLYMFWVIGLIKNLFFQNINYLSHSFDFFLKLPANFADILSGFLIYKVIRKRLNNHWAIAGSALYIFNPAIFFNSSIWGQYDSFASLFLLLSTYSIIIKQNPEISLSLLAIAWTVKPQALALTPVFILLILRNYPPLRWLTSAIFLFITTITLYLPFFPNNPLGGLIYVNSNSAQLFNCTTCYAFNFWGIFGNWKDDSQLFFGIPVLIWGIILLLVSFIIIFFSKPLSVRLKPPHFYLTAAVSTMAFFTLLTRMHERYLFPLFSFLLLAAILLRSKILIGFYIFISIVHLLNLYLPYAYYNNFPSRLLDILLPNFSLFSLISFLSFLLLIVYFIKND